MMPDSTLFLHTPTHFWVVFGAIVVALLLFDLGVLNRSEHEISAKESMLLYTFYVVVAAGFGGWVWYARGAEAGLEFFTGYLIEQSLAMDNMFVIAAIFEMLEIPRIHQRRVLIWGILGAIVFRAILIGLGAALVAAFSWVLSIFGAFLIVTGIKMFRHGRPKAVDVAHNPALVFLAKRVRITGELYGGRFWIRRHGENSTKPVLWLTPLGVALIMIELVDLTFAVDSVPAVFAITQDTFIVYTSNIFAVLGLRALYFSLAAAMMRFEYLQTSLAVVLVLIGTKILLVPLGIKIETWISLLVIASVLASGVLYSVYASEDRKKQIDPERHD
jgi:tellurite resistance protein TerC